MALVIADRVRETTTTTGTGSVTLAGAYTGFQTFSAAIGTGNSTYYTIANVASGEWEVGIGSYTAGGNTLSRTTVLASSNAGSLVNFGSGSKDVFVTQPAERALYVASSGTGLTSKVTPFNNSSVLYASSTSDLATSSNLTFNGTTLTANTLNLTNALGTSYGGTGLTSFTANGVVYASSSSALTTGSALVFDGTNLGVGGTTNSYGSQTTFTLSGSNVSRIDFRSNSTFTGTILSYQAVTEGLRLQTEAGYPITFYPAGTKAMTLDSAGNLGLGVTPSASTRPVIQVGAVGSVSNFIGTNTAIFGANFFYNGSVNKYISNGYANFYGISSSNGEHQWYTAPSGTGGVTPDTATFTQAMTLAASGFLGIGNTSPAYNLDLGSTVSGIIARFKTTGNYGTVVADNGNTTGGGAFSGRQNGTQYAFFGVDGALQGNTSTDTAIFADGSGSSIKFYTNGSATAKAILDSSGNLGIGVSTIASPSGSRRALQVSNSTSGGALYLSGDSTESNNPRIFGSVSTQYDLGLAAGGSTGFINYYTNGSERARIDSSGNLLVGTTSQLGSGKVGFLQSASGQVLTMQNSNATPYGIVCAYTGAAPNSTISQFIYCDDTGGLRMEVRSNGGIANYTANNVVLSDRREKTNFAPAGSYLDKICAIPVQTFNYIDQNMEDDGGLTLGVVAQDVQAVAPELVTEGNWGSKDEPKMRFEIYQTDLQYALMKALQELKAEFDAYKASHP